MKLEKIQEQQQMYIALQRLVGETRFAGVQCGDVVTLMDFLEERIQSLQKLAEKHAVGAK